MNCYLLYWLPLSGIFSYTSFLLKIQRPGQNNSMLNLFRSVQTTCVALQTISYVFIQSMMLLILDDSPVTQLCDMNELNYLGLFPVKTNALLCVLSFWGPNCKILHLSLLNAILLDTLTPRLDCCDNHNDDR